MNNKLRSSILQLALLFFTPLKAAEPVTEQQNIPNDILLKIIQECPAKFRVKIREVNQFTRTSLDAPNEKQKAQEEIAFDLVLQHKIYMTYQKRHLSGTETYFLPKPKHKLPKGISDMHDWCQNGYQFPFTEEPHYQYLTNGSYRMSTADYSFRLFCFGIHNGILPLIRYTLDQHSNFWNQADIVKKLRFDFAKTNYSLTAFLILKNDVPAFEISISNQDFRNFAFGTALKNGMRNTPLHTLAKYGKEPMISWFLGKHDLLDICLHPDNLYGEDHLTPSQIAKRTDKPEDVIALFLEAEQMIRSHS